MRRESPGSSAVKSCEYCPTTLPALSTPCMVTTPDAGTVGPTLLMIAVSFVATPLRTVFGTLSLENATSTLVSSGGSVVYHGKGASAAAVLVRRRVKRAVPVSGTYVGQLLRVAPTLI